VLQVKGEAMKKEIPPVGTRLRDPNGIVWRVIEALGELGILEAHGLTRKAHVERIADWAVVR
jgi:hypothetical protein